MERNLFLSIILVLLVHCSIAASVVAAVTNITVDQQALLTLKAHITDDPTNPLLSNWSSNTFFCNWTGVTCDVRDTITALNISHFDLRGTIPPQLGILSSLQTLDLSYNQLSGIIPSSIFNISSLQILDLSNNQLSGSFPSIIFNMTSLQAIRFGSNRLSGEVPGNVFDNLPSLKFLHLSGNMFDGRIPSTISKCKVLQLLNCKTNHFTGEIPREIGNLTKLQEINLGYNKLQGEIPGEIGNLHDLQELSLSSNNLSGPIPSGIFNISRLTIISLSLNQLSGTLPWSIGLTLPKLEELHLGGNKLSGNIPSSISNASMLTLLGLSYNSFSGFIPNSISDLRSLKLLNLGVLTVKSSVSGSSFLSSLTNLTALEDLYLSDIPLNDILPISIGNFTSLEILFLDYCNVKGSIPSEIGNLSNLMQLNLAFNEFSGSIPDAIGKLKNLQGFYLSDNELQGSIPTALCGIESLNEFMSDNNKLNGSLPECLDNLISLRYISLSFNRITSTIPSTMWSLKDIQYIDLSSNFINGSLPIEIGNLMVVTVLNLSRNQLSGDLPISFRGLKSLQNMSLADNRLQGAIPDSFGDLTSLELLDLSNNNLSGEIPNSLEDLSFLKNLNLSFNNLEGEIPGGGPFANFSAQSFIGNKALCGDPQLQVPPCKIKSHRKKPVRLLIYIVPGAAASTLLFLVIVFVLIRCRRRKHRVQSDNAEMSHRESWRRITYSELFRATAGFSESKILGKGSFGSVYKGTLQDGGLVAVKVFHLHLEGVLKSFETECEVLRNTRHRNLVKTISSCSNNHFKAMVIEYMPNGSLENFLYDNNCSFDILQGLNLAIDVASGLEYLHHGYFTPIVHCDLKPSNILLDENMVAHLSDFGIAKLLADEDCIARTQTLATVGYMAPEYGRDGKVSTKGDVYSYGIMLMEIFTRKKPTDEIFVGVMSLKRWVCDSLHNSITEVVDSYLLSREDEHFAVKEQCVLSILSIAMMCTSDSPQQRINMREVVNGLLKIRDTLPRFLKCVSMSFVMYCIFAMSFLAIEATTNITTDQSSLLALKAHITNDPHNLLADNWTASTSVCNWVGITCDSQNNRVIVLNLTSMSLTGTIPPQIGNLSFLVQLRLRNNSFHGSLPIELVQLHRLEILHLGLNSFQGEIPSWLGSLPKLQFLYLFGNHFTGTIPSTIFNVSSFDTIDLSNNSLSGSLPNDMCRYLPTLRRLVLHINQLNGAIPSSLWQCRELLHIYLDVNKFTGTIPRNIGNLSLLEELYLDTNNLEGSIPPEIGNLHNLYFLSLKNNSLVGPIPSTIFNISKLEVIGLFMNRLSGPIPSTIGLAVNLKRLYLWENELSSIIPDSISNASQLTILDLESNSFSGYIPTTLSNLRNLRSLSLASNQLTIDSSTQELNFLSSLTNYKFLRAIDLSNNPLSSPLPDSIGNLSTTLQEFWANDCKIKGSIPQEVGNLSNLTTLHLRNNELTGSVPTTINKMRMLQVLYLDGNRLQGSIPNEVCHLRNLGELYLSGNKFSGPIPAWNELSGEIPSSVGRLHSLVNFSIAQNKLQGPIPELFGNLVSLEILDLSSNNLSGTIPKSIEKLRYLQGINMSFNRLEGEIPTGGSLTNLSTESFLGNGKLCGAPRFQVPPCKASSRQGSKRSVLKPIIYMFSAIAVTILVLAIVFLLFRSQKKKLKLLDEEDLSSLATRRRISFQELDLATNGFDEGNILGTGGFGSVYKGKLLDGTIIAVKVFNLQFERALRSFNDECEVMSKIRHRNLVKIISSCSNNIDFKALILEYMANGSLEKWLYCHNNFFDVLQRLNIMIDVASALEYLHNGYGAPIVHCDLKPNNILLGEDMVARVGDFGIAKLLGEEDSMTQTHTLATIGYMAPEYGSEGIVSTRGDVYSFGILLMETFTRKKPTDNMFEERLSLQCWIKDALPHSVTEVADANLLGEENLSAKKDCILSILQVAVDCTVELPESRLDITNVLGALQNIKTKFHKNVART
ncbi:hypothetical protein Ddye_024256 [Dipteronia dyeriana]|uniref:non-specific serine/threonine protein kinase n=1 Tax=Dipteronia dyeriana TaxID=168575 RepID=A0AAD9TV55_9ROSI|nr:hypothetical protein Ddye_024256 [Dipteronia dyeriana]